MKCRYCIVKFHYIVGRGVEKIHYSVGRGDLECNYNVGRGESNFKNRIDPSVSPSPFEK